MSRMACIGLAVTSGWLVYILYIFAAIVLIPGFYDPLMIFSHPILGLIVSICMVGLALLTGLILQVPAIRIVWEGSQGWISMLIGISIFLLCFGCFLGLNETNHFTIPETDTDVSYQWLRFDVSMTCYFWIIFCIANWPIPKSA